MTKVKNKRAIINLAISSIRANVKKYAVMVCAVILTTILFSSFFTVGGSMINEMQEGSMRQSGGCCHATIKYLTEAEYNLIKDDKKAKSVTYRIHSGELQGKIFNEFRTELSYYEPLAAKEGFCYPEVGKLPEKENEIVLSDIILNELGVPLEVGSKLTLDVKVRQETFTKDFILSGYFKGDKLSFSQIGMVSKAFQEKYAPTQADGRFSGDAGEVDGCIDADIMFHSSRNIEKQTIALIERSGLDSNTEYGVNWAYLQTNMDPTTTVLGVVLLITFMIAGYLIIYNIFDLNIISDIQEYGLLKTIGTTGKQLRKVVAIRARIISLIGIPIGLLIGVGVGTTILPAVSNNMITGALEKGKLHMNIWIILLAAAFSYLTVAISARKPCVKASKVSPIETIKYTEERGKNGKPKKKLVTVILSLSLALVVLNSVVTIVKSFSMDDFIKLLIISDYSIQDETLDNPGASVNITDAVDKSFLDELAKQDGIEGIGNVYVVKNRSHEFSEETWKIVHDKFLKDEMVRKSVEEHLHSHSEEDITVDQMLEMYDTDRTLDGKTYGMSELAVDKLEVSKTIDGTDTIDWEKFNSGDYVLVARWDYENGVYRDIFEPGDKIQVQSNDPKYETTETVYGDNGEEFEIPSYTDAPFKEYTVYATVDIPHAMQLQCYGMLDCDVILPEEEFLNLNGDWNAMRTLVDVEDSKEAAFEEWLDNYTENVNDSLCYKSKESVMEEYKSFTDMIAIIGIVVALIMGLIGIMNFGNTIITSIITRSRELAMLEAVGMTGKQQRRSLMKEGMVYFGWTGVVATALSTLLSVTAVRAIANGLPMLEWKFTLTPLVACLPFICILILIIPVIAYKNLSKKSVVDRLRED